VAGSKYEDAVNVLMELDVISGYPDGSYKPAGIVTRGEMAKIIVCALGLEDYAAGASSFSDMAGHWSDKYVAYAVSLGIINGYPDGTFKPDNTVTYDEAAKMLVAALGYTEDALIGTWPANWVTKAKTLGILDGIKSGSAGANRGDIAIMAFQTLACEIGKVNKDGEWKGAPVGQPVDNMLARLGASDYVPPGGAITPDVANPDRFIVEGDESSIINLKPYMGALVTAYKNGDGDIIAIKEVFSVFLTGKVDAAAANIAVGDKFEADKDYTFDTGAITAYITFTNGEEDAFSPITPQRGTEYTISAKVSGSKIKELYATSMWTLTDHFMFEDGDLEDDALGGYGFKMDDDDDDEIDMKSFALYGVASLEDIKEDNVVYVYTNGDGIAKIEVGTEVVKGEITRITGGDKYTIGGKVYKVASQTSGFATTILDVENEIEAYLDYDGKIYDADKLSGSKAENYGIVLGGVNKASYITDAKLELFLEDGTEKIFTVDVDEAKIAGVAFNYGTNINDDDLVKYGLNKDGEIDVLTIVTPSIATKTGGPPAKANITKAGYVDGIKIASDAFIVLDADITGSAFVVDASADEYTIGDLSKLLEDSYDDILYVEEDDQIVVLIVEGAGSGGDEFYGVLNGKFSEPGVTNDATLMVDGKDEGYSSDAPVNTANDQYLYKIVGKTDGKYTLTYLNAGAPLVGTKFSGAYIENNRIKDGIIGGLNLPVTSSTVVYKYDDGWTKINLNGIKKSDEVYLYQTDDDNPEVVTFVLVNGKDTTAPTVTGASFIDATTLEIKFDKAVNAVKGDFSDGKITGIGTFTVSAVAGSGTDTLTLTVAGTPAIATGNTGTIDIAATVKDTAGNALVALDDQLITSGF
jgi:hypothetical protein